MGIASVPRAAATPRCAAAASGLATLLPERRRDLRRGLAELTFEPVVAAETFEQHDRVPVRRAVPQADDREAPHSLVVVGGREPVELRAQGVHRAGAVAREPLEGDQRRATARRALVVEPAAQQLDLLAEPELADGAKGRRPFAVVGAARAAFDLVLPLPAQVGELALLALLGEGLGPSRCLLEGQLAEPPFSDRGAGPT